MVEDTGNLAKQSPDILGSNGDIDIEKLLDSEGEALLIRHHGNVIETIEVGQSLEVGLVLDQLLGTSMKQADVGVGTNNFLSAQFENQPQHAVGGGMLGTKVDGVVADLSVLDGVFARLCGLGMTLFQVLAVGVIRVGKALVYGNKLDANIVRLGISPNSCRRDGSRDDGSSWPEAKSLGAVAGESGHRGKRHHVRGNGEGRRVSVDDGGIGELCSSLEPFREVN